MDSFIVEEEEILSVMLKRSRYKGPILGSVLDTETDRVGASLPGIRCCICSKDWSVSFSTDELPFPWLTTCELSDVENDDLESSSYCSWCRDSCQLTDCRWWFDSPQSASETQDRRPAER